MFIPKLWICLKEYCWKSAKADVLAGITVGIVALPLAMAFAIASGVGPEKGLYTAIIAGFLVSCLGGSRFQIGGPTGAFVVIIYGIIVRFGYQGLVIITIMAGILLIAAALCRLGTWIKLIPYPLIMGFTTGIGFVIFTAQIKDFFGFPQALIPMNFTEQWKFYIHAFATFHGPSCVVGTATLFCIVCLRKYLPQLPWGIGAIAIVSIVCFSFGIEVETVAARFGQIPRTLTLPHLPFFSFDIHVIKELLPDALVVAFLAGVEALLSALVADGMTGTRHKSNCELFAQGIANIGSAFFGGIPATGALARTATNIRAGAKTPVAGVVHAVTLVLIMLLFAPLVGKIPLSAIAAVLMVVAWNMAELSNFYHLFKAPLGDIIVLLTTFFLTIFADLVVAVEVGLILSALIFMKRMVESSTKIEITSKLDEEEIEDWASTVKAKIPEGVEVCEITGPFFFGVVDRLKEVHHEMKQPPKIFILRMGKVSVIDATGLHALREFFYKCRREKTKLFFSEVRGEIGKHLRRFGVFSLVGQEYLFPHLEAALLYSRKLIEAEKDFP